LTPWISKTERVTNRDGPSDKGPFFFVKSIIRRK